MKRKKTWIIISFGIILLGLSLPEIIHINKEESKSTGSVGNGKIENAHLIPYSGKNYRYFSPLSYYILNDAYMNSRVNRTLIQAYEECESTCKGTKFKIMECSNKKGGKMLMHRTHQNGLSVDFMMPKQRKERQYKLFDKLGLWHYLLSFNEEGELKTNQKVSIDFNTMGKHILALDNASRANGLRIKKVILKIDLKDDFYQTESGQKVKSKGIYFAKALPEMVDNMHDDHYHIDFETVQ